MSIDEAISELKYARTMLEFNPTTGDVGFRNDEDRRQAEAIDMAIEALQTEPCEDCISREAALDTVDSLKIVIANNLPEFVYKSNVLKLLHDLPSVQPEQKEITMEDVKAYCEPRNLVVLTKELFDQMNNTADKIYFYLKDRERR